ncbi:hypothetical protein [Poseidonibacter lekithochrous]|uniref:hypothetical protein n=1 Tax=Poseidonibacter lekithochrous TaxID=1904463 RepID=UPI000D3ADFA3|nr:hypothetical protein [Poseidonibacter lekithochrous]
MEDIRLIDINSISENAVKHNNKHRGNTHPIWEKIKSEYLLEDFLQIQLPLQRVKRAASIYDDYKFKLEYISLIRRAFINNLNIDTEYLELLFTSAKESLNGTTTNKELKKRYTEVEIIDKDGNSEHLRLLEDGLLIKPLAIETVSKLQDYDLLTYLDKVREKQNLSTKKKHIYEVALKEAMKRGLVLDISPHEANERK